MSKQTIEEQVVNLTERVSSQQQMKMINDLKDKGLLNTPKYNLAYGAPSFSNVQTSQ